MVTITLNEITNFKMRISKAYNEYASAETATIHDMRIARHTTDVNALDLIMSIHCGVMTARYSAFEQFVRNYDDFKTVKSTSKRSEVDDTPEISIAASYTLRPIKEVHIRDVYTSALNVIDRLQETLNTLYKHESNILIINPFSVENFCFQAERAVEDFFKREGTSYEDIPRFL